MKKILQAHEHIGTARNLVEALWMAAGDLEEDMQSQAIRTVAMEAVDKMRMALRLISDALDDDKAERRVA